jgi:hypothetical protein
MSTFPFAEHRMNLSKIRQSIGHLKTKIFGFASSEQPYWPAGYGPTCYRDHRIRAHETGALRLSVSCSRRRGTSDAVTRNHPDHCQGVRGPEGSGPRSRDRRTRAMETALHLARRTDAGLSIGRSRKARRTTPLKQMLGSGSVSHFPAECNFGFPAKCASPRISSLTSCLHGASPSAHKVIDQDYQRYHE